MPLRKMPFNRLGASIALGLLVVLVANVTGVGARPEDSCITSSTDSIATLGSELNILSWNIQKASRDGWAADLERLSEGVQLAFIQEASLQANIPAALSQPLVSAFSAGYTTPTQATGVMTLSPGTPALHCNATAWEPLLRTPKATSITEYPLQGREERLLAINLHAVNFTLGVQNFQRQFESLSQRIGAHNGPIIFAGDLNTWSQNRQALVEDFMRKHALKAIEFKPDLRSRAFGRALDHIYTRGLEATAAEVVPVSSSDHNPLRVRLALQ